MSRATLQRIPLRANHFQGLGQKIHRVLFATFVLQVLVVWLNLAAGVPNFGAARWPEGLLLVWCAASLIAGMTRHLPGQNVMLASAIIVVISGLAHTLGALISIPFGPFRYTDRIGQVLFPGLPWAIPAIWLVAIFSSRGAARLIMRPWRKTRSYGFWVMSLTVALVLLFDLGLEPFATEVKHYWIWSPTKAGLFWYETPWVNFLGWAATCVLILGFATPSLINKKPVKRQEADFYPLVIWVVAMGVFLTGAATRHLWMAVVVEAIAVVVVASFAVKGGIW